jgi:hypothetical protein
MRAREHERRVSRRSSEAPPPDLHPLLALQRGVGNQAVVRMVLAREWAEDVRSGDKLVELYRELAGLVDAGRLEDVKGEINTALRPAAAELKPGLNFVARLPSRGQTGYLIGNELTIKLPTERSGPEPKVAVMLGPLAFDPGNKAAAIGVLRHELEHAFHDRLAANLLKRWREDAGAEKTPFAAWLGKQSISASDRELVDERVAAGKTDTEALAHLEGFIAGFAVEAPDVSEGAHPVYENELVDAAAYWASSDKAVKAEFIARLKAFKGRLKGERLTALTADLKKLKAADKAYAALVDGVLG